jgi:hypothetical protein
MFYFRRAKSCIDLVTNLHRHRLRKDPLGLVRFPIGFAHALLRIKREKSTPAIIPPVNSFPPGPLPVQSSHSRMELSDPRYVPHGSGRVR